MAQQLQKVDFKRTHKELYTAKKTVQVVEVGKGAFLAVEGVGAPGGPGFQEAIGKLYGLAYTTKFMLKKAGVLDFGVPNLECLWFDDPSDTPRAQWRWRLLIRIPEEVTAQHLKDARAALKERKGTDTSDVKRLSWAEGSAVQVMHIGPYDQVSNAYKALAAYAEVHGLTCAGTGHEVYISDPRRVAPEKLKTIVRMAVTASKR